MIVDTNWHGQEGSDDGDMGHLTMSQIVALKGICRRFGVKFNPDAYKPTFDLPAGYVAGWVGPIYIGCSRDGEISS